MRVNIKDSVYGMLRKEYKKFLKVASNAVSCGIYAVEKAGTSIILNERYCDVESLNKAVSGYKEKGVKVYYNE